MFQDDNPTGIPEDYNVRKLPPAKGVPRGSFRVLNLTPRSMDLLDAVIDRSADFDRSLAETRKAGEDEDGPCSEATESNLKAYGDLVQAKGKMAEYLARLMDRVNDPGLNEQRSVVVRYD